MTSPLRISVVGHVNTGKTSLIATLARRSDLATGDGRTTVAVQEITFECRGNKLLILVDTPGFESLSEIIDELDERRSTAADAGHRKDDLDLLTDFLADARADPRPELDLDIHALEAALESDVILYVVDVTQEPLERLRDEVAMLVRTARPVVGVLNFTAEPDTHERDWREVFRREKVHAMVAFDVMVNDSAAEAELFRTMAAVVRDDRRRAVDELREAQEGEATRQRQVAIRTAADSLLSLLTLEVAVPIETPNAETHARRELESRAAELERLGLAALGRAHGFSGTEVDLSAAASTSEVLRDGLFDPAALRRHAPDLLTMAASGAAVGGTVDLMVGGASFFAGTVIGGVAGLVGGLVRRAVKVQSTGERVIGRLHADMAWLILARLVAAHDAYRARTHARRDVVGVGSASDAPLRKHPAAAELVERLKKAQDDPRLSGSTVSPRRRAEELTELERRLSDLMH